MDGHSFVPEQPENTAFLKELQWKENKSQDDFLGNLLTDEKISRDHIALKHSSSSGSGSSGATKQHITKPFSTGSLKKAVDDPDIYTQLSVNLWKRINAGYLVPSRPPSGVMRSVFTYNPSLIEPQSMEFHRKRNFYSEYNEAAARFKLVHGNKKPLSKAKKAGEKGIEPTANNEKSTLLPSSLGSEGAKPVDVVSTNNAGETTADQTGQTSTPAIDTNPSGQSSAPTTLAAESKPTEP